MDIGGGLKFRNAEVAATVAELEKDHETAEDAARAVLRVAFSALLEREMWITVVLDPLPWATVAYTFFTEGAARKAVEENTIGALSSQRVAVLHLRDGEKRAEWVKLQ